MNIILPPSSSHPTYTWDELSEAAKETAYLQSTCSYEGKPAVITGLRTCILESGQDYLNGRIIRIPTTKVIYECMFYADGTVAEGD